jgi:hypothetical protein
MTIVSFKKRITIKEIDGFQTLGAAQAGSKQLMVVFDSVDEIENYFIEIICK